MNATFLDWSLAAVIIPPLWVLSMVVDLVSGDLESELIKRRVQR